MNKRAHHEVGFAPYALMVGALAWIWFKMRKKR